MLIRILLMLNSLTIINSMKSLKMKRNQFQEQFEDSQANYSEANQYQNPHRPQGSPIQLIKINQNGKIEVNEDALNLIAQYNSPIGFVSLVGKMRTGKSCLLNRLLQLTGQGFKVDPSVTSCTQGIWMWSEPEFNHVHNNYIFYLDTEGTDSLEKDIENDTKIFTLSLLIASYFIYNSIGSIDERSLGQLEMVTALSKQIKADEKLSDRDNQQNLCNFLPKFLWVLRDFTLKIEDDRGRKISATQYLQNCLNDQGYGERINEDSRKIKKSITNYFRDRQCLTLVRPVGDQIELQRLNSIPDHALRRQFISGIETLREKILKNAGPKTYQGEMVTGPAMASMIENYIEAFNSGKVPNIKSAWQQISEDEGASAYNRAYERYVQIFGQEFPNDTPKGQEIYAILSRLRDETLREFDENCGANKNEQYRKKLKDLIQEKQQNIIEINNNFNESRNHEILKKYTQKLRAKLESNKSTKEEISNDLNQVIKTYNKQAKGEKKSQILADFISSFTPIMMSLQTNDTTQQEQEKRKAQIKIEEYQKQMRLQKEQIQSMQKQLIAKQEADKIKAANSKIPEKNQRKEREKKEAGGCCSGDKCEIM